MKKDKNNNPLCKKLLNSFSNLTGEASKTSVLRNILN